MTPSMRQDFFREGYEFMRRIRGYLKQC